MKKRILTFVLSLVMILSCVVSSALVVSADDMVTATENWYTEADTLYIENASDLLAFARALDEDQNFDGQTIYLCNDIVLNSGSVENWNPNDANFIKYVAHNVDGKFCGTFDGQGHVISGLYTIATSTNAAALIPYATGNATIRNVTILNSYFGGEQYISTVVGSYEASTLNSVLTIENVHVEDTTINATKQDSAGFLGYVGDADCTGIEIIVQDVTFVGGSITVGRHSGGIVGRIYNTKGYDKAVSLTMSRIVLNTDLKLSHSNTDIKSGSLIGNLNGFHSVNVSNVFIGGTLTVVTSNSKNSAGLVGILSDSTTNVSGDNRAILDVTNVLLAQVCNNVNAVWFNRAAAYDGTNTKSAKDKFTNVYYDSDVVKIDDTGATGCKALMVNDVPDSETAKSFATLKGTQAGYTGWIAVKDSYPVPTARPARLLGYQSSYATDVKDANNANETYSIRLIAALNDTFYTYAGFENITITYTDGNGQPVNVPKENYFCNYAYTSVIGTDKTGAVQTYTASEYYADYLIALVITGIPENVTEFTVTVNPFAGNGDVSFAGLTKTVQISAQ